LTCSKCAGEVTAKQFDDKFENMFFSPEGIGLFGFCDYRK